MKLLDVVKYKTKTLAIILYKKYKFNGINFFTPDNFSQQLGYMSRPKSYVIAPHFHKKVKREVHYTKEVLFIKSGKVRVDFYNNKKKFIKHRVLSKGDIILLADGGHGFKMLKPTEMIEVKQGPYVGDKDKIYL
jgi:mannose-6-phosphate isomerase-like protein (cupin superfamily)